ncbi:MAG: efflux RND transporter periplasmic adaptor subunit [Verrucomicrobium sp.]|nr:efflux RND transporter periplasmic adaptor subunit [Verrucomicrobium sp.]
MNHPFSIQHTNPETPQPLGRRRFIAGMAGALLLAGCSKAAVTSDSKASNVDYYTCTMHPSVRSQDPKGKCPICGMDLVPVMKQGTDAAGTATAATAAATAVAPETNAFDIPPERLQAIGASSGVVERREMQRPLNAPATVVIAESGLRDINVKSGGYIVKLYADYVGKPVTEGQPLMTVLVEGWIDAQLDYIKAYRSYARTSEGGMNRNSLLAFDAIDRMRKRLRVWDMSDAQIADLEKFALEMNETDLRSGKGLKGTFDVLSPVSGHVMEKTAIEGMRFEAGQSLLKVVDLSTVWVQADFPEDQARYVSPGQEFQIRFPSRPGQSLTAQVDFINPHLMEETRRQTVRFVVSNPGHQLSPGMYASVEGNQMIGTKLAVPASAVIPTGRRYVVFLDHGGGKLEPKFVDLGEKYGDFYEVLSGLAENDRVITSANFLIDAESRVQGALKTWGESQTSDAAQH